MKIFRILFFFLVLATPMFAQSTINLTPPSNGNFYRPGEVVRGQFTNTVGNYLNILEVISRNASKHDLKVVTSGSEQYPPNIIVQYISVVIPHTYENPNDSLFKIRIVSVANTWESKEFTIRSGNVPHQKEPENGLRNLPLTLPLRWNTVPAAERYHLQISTTFFNPLFAFSSDEILADNLIFNDSTLTATTTTISNLQPSTWYYWRIRTFQNGAWASWTYPASFSTGTALGVESSGRESTQHYSVIVKNHTVCIQEQAVGTSQNPVIILYDILGNALANWSTAWNRGDRIFALPPIAKHAYFLHITTENSHETYHIISE